MHVRCRRCWGWNGFDPRTLTCLDCGLPIAYCVRERMEVRWSQQEENRYQADCCELKPLDEPEASR